MTTTGAIALLYIVIGMNIGWLVVLLLQRARWWWLLLPGSALVGLLLLLRLGIDSPEALKNLAA